MKPMLPAAFVKEYLRQRDLLLQAYPELADDEAALQDTTEGITHAPDMIAGIIRDAREDEANATALSLMIREMSDRKARFSARAERRYTMAEHLMEAIGLRKLAMPDFTASITPTQPRVMIDDETALPHYLVKLVRQPDKTKIKEALTVGTVAGAHMSNGGSTLTVRTK